MVIIHIANIDPDVIGGVCIAVPQMVRAQSKYADIGLINTSGKAVNGVRELHFGEKPDIADLPEPFNKPDIIIFMRYTDLNISGFTALPQRQIYHT